MGKDAVFKLLKRVDVKDVSGEVNAVKIHGVEGVIPVYMTKEEAVDESCDGKYPIYAIREQSD